jgi:hypothetical protein
MNEMIHLLSNFLLGELSPFSKPHRYLSLRFMANMGAFFLLGFGYILGCRALYHYAEPKWGEVYTLLIIGLTLLVTSLLLFFIGWLLKPKEPHLKEVVSNIEKAISEIPNNELIKKVLANIPLKSAAAILAAVIITSYLKKSSK